MLRDASLGLKRHFQMLQSTVWIDAGDRQMSDVIQVTVTPLQLFFFSAGKGMYGGKKMLFLTTLKNICFFDQVLIPPLQSCQITLRL